MLVQPALRAEGVNTCWTLIGLAPQHCKVNWGTGRPAGRHMHTATPLEDNQHRRLSRRQALWPNTTIAHILGNIHMHRVSNTGQSENLANSGGVLEGRELMWPAVLWECVPCQSEGTKTCSQVHQPSQNPLDSSGRACESQALQALHNVE